MCSLLEKMTKHVVHYLEQKKRKVICGKKFSFDTRGTDDWIMERKAFVGSNHVKIPFAR